jgi:hypothetical protein
MKNNECKGGARYPPANRQGIGNIRHEILLQLLAEILSPNREALAVANASGYHIKTSVRKMKRRRKTRMPTLRSLKMSHRGQSPPEPLLDRPDHRRP